MNDNEDKNVIPLIDGEDKSTADIVTETPVVSTSETAKPYDFTKVSSPRPQSPRPPQQPVSMLENDRLSDDLSMALWGSFRKWDSATPITPRLKRAREDGAKYIKTSKKIAIASVAMMVVGVASAATAFILERSSK